MDNIRVVFKIETLPRGLILCNGVCGWGNMR